MSARSWFSRALLPWYDAHRRDLPWRRTRDPYRIWISEVILQQTRVDQGTAYYERFIRVFPSVRHLAGAREQEVLKLWQGLGYYGRARNLHAAAKQVMREHGGTLPRDHDQLLRLKGVGEYTAAAIASIAFDRPHAVVDGNVYRVLARVFGISLPIDGAEGRKEFRELAASLVDHGRPGDHNQAVMELGATVCTPRDPDCGACPVRSRCVARMEGRIGALPAKAAKKKARVRHFNYLWLERGGRIRMTRRGTGDIWSGLHELPLIETRGRTTAAGLRRELERILGAGGGNRTLCRASGPFQHVLSHQRIIASLWKVEGDLGPGAPVNWRSVQRARIAALPTHRLMERLLHGVIAP